MTRQLLTPVERDLLASCRTPNEVIFCEALVEDLGPLSEPGSSPKLAKRTGVIQRLQVASPGSESGHISSEDLQLWSDT
jgi:hypothetical protein